MGNNPKQEILTDGIKRNESSNKLILGLWFNAQSCQNTAYKILLPHLLLSKCVAQNGLSSGAISFFQYHPTKGMLSNTSRRKGGTSSAKKTTARPAATPIPATAGTLGRRNLVSPTTLQSKSSRFALHCLSQSASIALGWRGENVLVSQ
jgi:hypothetical protein